MNDIDTSYTTINPKTGNLTEEKEFVNSWKWDNEEVSTHFRWGEDNTWVRDDIGWKRNGFDNETQQIRSLVNKYDLPLNTPLKAVKEIARLTNTQKDYQEKYEELRTLNQEYLVAMEIASFERKGMKKKQKEAKKEIKAFLKLVEDYLTHKPNCVVPALKAVGRTRANSRCNCGLKKALNSIKL